MTDETNHQLNESTLRELYHKKNLSMQEVADEIGCTFSKVRYRMNKHDIDRRSRSQSITMAFGAPTMETSHQGYEKFQHRKNGEDSVLLVHRLLAVAEYGFDYVENTEIHHENGIPWDNRPKNITPLSVSEHKTRHGVKHALPTKLLIMELAHKESMKRREIAEITDVPLSTVCSVAAEATVGV